MGLKDWVWDEAVACICVACQIIALAASFKKIYSVQWYDLIRAKL